VVRLARHKTDNSPQQKTRHNQKANIKTLRNPNPNRSSSFLYQNQKKEFPKRYKSEVTWLWSWGNVVVHLGCVYDGGRLAGLM
jgi:hypothetical protein